LWDPFLPFFGSFAIINPYTIRRDWSKLLVNPYGPKAGYNCIRIFDRFRIS